jgi:hypothetical protein
VDRRSSTAKGGMTLMTWCRDFARTMTALCTTGRGCVWAASVNAATTTCLTSSSAALNAALRCAGAAASRVLNGTAISSYRGVYNC